MEIGSLPTWSLWVLCTEQLLGFTARWFCCLHRYFTHYGKRFLRWENKYKTTNADKEKLYKRLDSDSFEAAGVPSKYWCAEWGALGFKRGDTVLLWASNILPTVIFISVVVSQLNFLAWRGTFWDPYWYATQTQGPKGKRMHAVKHRAA